MPQTVFVLVFVFVSYPGVSDGIGSAGRRLSAESVAVAGRDAAYCSGAGCGILGVFFLTAFVYDEEPHANNYCQQYDYSENHRISLKSSGFEHFFRRYATIMQA